LFSYIARLFISFFYFCNYYVFRCNAPRPHAPADLTSTARARRWSTGLPSTARAYRRTSGIPTATPFSLPQRQGLCSWRRGPPTALRRRVLRFPRPGTPTEPQWSLLELLHRAAPLSPRITPERSWRRHDLMERWQGKQEGDSGRRLGRQQDTPEVGCVAGETNRRWCSCRK
jgi:hypothetical protein